jgi:hypothetical protein
MLERGSVKDEIGAFEYRNQCVAIAHVAKHRLDWMRTGRLLDKEQFSFIVVKNADFTRLK